MRPIKTLTLSFPYGANITECEAIAQYAQDQVMAGVSEGGMATTNKYGIYVDDVTFSEDHMHYVYGHNRDQSVTVTIDGEPRTTDARKGDE